MSLLYKVSVCYAGKFADPDIRQFIAEKFDLAIIDAYFQGAAEVKEINPNIKIIFYADMIYMHATSPAWEEVNQHEDWFLHDINGNRLVNKTYGAYLMNPASSGWAIFYTDGITKMLSNFPDLDGVFADDAGPIWRDVFTVPKEQVPEFPSWHDDIKAFLNYVKGRIGVSRMLIPNAGSYVDLATVADGIMVEHAFHNLSSGPTQFLSNPIKILEGISTYASLFAANKKAMLLLSGCTTENPQIQKYTLAASLLGAEYTTVYGWNFIYRPSKGWFPEMGIETGAPLGPYYQDGDLYKRDFEQAEVSVDFVNHVGSIKKKGMKNWLHSPQ